MIILKNEINLSLILAYSNINIYTYLQWDIKTNANVLHVRLHTQKRRAV